MKSVNYSKYELINALHGEESYDKNNETNGSNTDDKSNGGYNHAPWYSCFFSLASTVVGAGILGLPYAFAQTGWILGTIFLIICASLSCFACHLMSEAALKTRIPSSYRTVTQTSLPYYSKIIDLIVTFKGIGIATSYLIVVIDSITLVFDAWSFPIILQNRFIILLLSYVIIVPVSSLPTLHAMKITTIISACMILFIIFLIFLYSLNITSISMLNPCVQTTESTCHGEYIYIQTDTWITLKTFPIFIFSFGCQQNTFSVVNELRRPNYYRINFIFIAALGAALLLSMISCYAGYTTYGSKVYSDILRNYPENALTTSCRLFISMIVICHYPLQLHPARESAMSLWYQYANASHTTSSTTTTDISKSIALSTMISSSNPIHKHVPLRTTDIEEDIDDGYGYDREEDSTMVTSTKANNSKQRNMQMKSSAGNDDEEEEEESIVFQSVAQHKVLPSIPEQQLTICKLLPPDVYQRRYIICTIAFTVSTFLIAGSLQDLGIVLSILGATLSTTVVFILPGIFYYVIFMKEHLQRMYTNPSSSDPRNIWSFSMLWELMIAGEWKLLGAYGLIGFGYFVMITALGCIIIEAFTT